MKPIDEMVEEVNRFVEQDAGGDPLHPGARLRVLLLLTLAEGEQLSALAQDIAEAGFLPVRDRFDPDAGLSFCSMESVARALGAPVSVVAREVESFLRSPIAERLGFTFEILFPCGGEQECALH